MKQNIHYRNKVTQRTSRTLEGSPKYIQIRNLFDQYTAHERGTTDSTMTFSYIKANHCHIIRIDKVHAIQTWNMGQCTIQSARPMSISSLLRRHLVHLLQVPSFTIGLFLSQHICRITDKHNKGVFFPSQLQCQLYQSHIQMHHHHHRNRKTIPFMHPQTHPPEETQTYHLSMTSVSQ